MIRMISLIFIGHVENWFDKQSNDSFENLEEMEDKKRERGFNKLLHTPIEHEKEGGRLNNSTTGCNDDDAV